MAAQIYQRLDLATNQLETAIGLFIGGHDRFSVITLAGAADGIFTQLVNNRGNESFTEILAKEDDDKTMTVSQMGSHVNTILFVNELKHMDKDDDGYVVMDAEECALATILKALANFVTLRGDKVGFVKAFLLWVRLNLDPRKYNVNCDPNWKPTPTE
jgi:hypothetical protein